MDTNPLKDVGADPALLDGWLDRAELARQLALSVDTLQRWETRRVGPPCVRVACRANSTETAAYLCEHCEAPIAERHKTWMMDEENGADWLPTAAPDVQASAETAGVIGFHISGLYSPLGWLSWEEIARRWDQAQGNDSALKTVKNTVLGETWAERGEAPDWQRLYERREDWGLCLGPPGWHGQVIAIKGVAGFG